MGVWKMRSVENEEYADPPPPPLYKYFVNFDIKCSQNQTLKQADLDLSFIKV